MLLSEHDWGGKGEGKVREVEASTKKQSGLLHGWFHDKGVGGLRANKLMAKGSFSQILVGQFISLGLDFGNIILLAFRGSKVSLPKPEHWG